jgi:hypothetical protein
VPARHHRPLDRLAEPVYIRRTIAQFLQDAMTNNTGPFNTPILVSTLRPMPELNPQRPPDTLIKVICFPPPSL